jgi:hypothetical protein
MSLADEKQAFILANGVTVTVQRLDGTSYQTRMLYRRVSRPSGTFATSFVFSVEYLRGGVFIPTDDIQHGYIVTVEKTGETMFVASYLPNINFDVETSITAYMVLLNFPTQVQLTQSQASENVTRDKFGKPATTSTSTTIGITISKADLVIDSNVAGGKPTELLEFYARAGTIKENDEFTWNGHTYRTTSIWPFGFADTSQLLQCKAQREIDK